MGKKVYEWCKACAKDGENKNVMCLACIRATLEAQNILLESPNLFREKE